MFSRPPLPGNRRALLYPILCGGLVMGLALGIRHVQGLFMLPMTQEHGWSRETFAFALAIQNLALGLAQPVVGLVADRYGAPRVVAASAALYALGLWAMSAATTALGLYVGCGLMIGVALAGTAFGVIYGALSRLAPAADRGWTLGMAGAIGGLGQFVAVPATQWLQDRVGWGGALLALGGAIAAMAMLVPGLNDRSSAAARAVATPDHAARQSVGQAVSEALRHRGFWLLNLGFLACGFQLAFLASHLPAYLLDKGASAQLAVTGLAVIALANVAGTFGCGRLGDLYRRKNVLAAVYLARAAAIALFISLPVSSRSVILFCAVMGLLWLGTAPLTNALVAQVFGVQYIGTLFGLVFLGHQVGAFLGVWLGGRIFDATRSYDAVWLGAIALSLVAAALHWGIDDRPVIRAPAPQPA